MNKIKQSILAIVIGLAMAGGVSWAQTTWTPPCDNPPNCNTPTPINVGIIPQSKGGGLELTSLTYGYVGNGTSVFKGATSFKGLTGFLNTATFDSSAIFNGLSQFNSNVGIGITPTAASPKLEVAGKIKTTDL